MKITPEGRAWAKVVKGLRSGEITWSVKAIPPDRSDGLFGLYEYDRARVPYIELGPNISYDNFFRKTDNFTLPQDIIFYRGTIVSAYSHIDHLLDDLCYRLACTEHYRGFGRYCDKTDEKIKQLLELSYLIGPFKRFNGRIKSASLLIRKHSVIRNLSAHAVFSMHSSDDMGRLVYIRNFGRAKPAQGGMAMNDRIAVMTIKSLSRAASRIDLLARHLDSLHYRLCMELGLPDGLLQIK